MTSSTPRGMPIKAEKKVEMATMYTVSPVACHSNWVSNWSNMGDHLAVFLRYRLNGVLDGLLRAADLQCHPVILLRRIGQDRRGDALLHPCGQMAPEAVQLIGVDSK